MLNYPLSYSARRLNYQKTPLKKHTTLKEFSSSDLDIFILLNDHCRSLLRFEGISIPKLPPYRFISLISLGMLDIESNSSCSPNSDHFLRTCILKSCATQFSGNSRQDQVATPHYSMNADGQWWTSKHIASSKSQLKATSTASTAD